MASKKPKKTSELERIDLGYKVQLSDPAGELACPTLLDIMRPRFKEGLCRRLGASLNIRVVGGNYVVRVSCPTEEVQATVVVESLAQLEVALEAALRAPSCVWLPDYESQKKSRREATE